MSAHDIRRSQGAIVDRPYSISAHTDLANSYEALRYPDLATGSFYKAVLLLDAILDDSDEYHTQATECLSQDFPNVNLEDISSDHISDALHDVFLTVYDGLARNLCACGCYKSAQKYCQLAISRRRHSRLDDRVASIRAAVNQRAPENDLASPDTWPDSGLVRRQVYPWNDHEPDRYSTESLALLNDKMQKVAPHLEVKVTDLRDLTADTDDATHKVVKQLGVYATRDFEPGETVLSETSLLTANNRLQDSLCDACSLEVVPHSAGPTDCVDCSVVFCSQTCHDAAMDTYHPAVCDRGLDSLSRDVPAADAADSLYLLLLMRALAMAETLQSHPLDLFPVKYIWGDFTQPDSSRTGHDEGPRTLPFSFQLNVVLPFDILTKMDVDIFANPSYDVWIFNTLYAKFRGTASARLSGLKGTTARGPEVSAVHPLWCLANHSCDPNVSWEWGGRMEFKARTTRPIWRRNRLSSGDDTEQDMHQTSPGIKQGQEILGHYCDVDLPVRDRREWAAGALGGKCRCDRCVWEANERP